MKRRKFLQVTGAVAAARHPGLLTLTSTEHTQGGVRAVSILKSADRITTDTAAQIYGRHKVPGTKQLIRHDVDVYRVTYATRDSDGSEVVASGAVLVPKTALPLRVIC